MFEKKYDLSLTLSEGEGTIGVVWFDLQPEETQVCVSTLGICRDAMPCVSRQTVIAKMLFADPN